MQSNRFGARGWTQRRYGVGSFRMTGLQASPRNPFATHVGGDRQRALVRLIGELDVASVPSAEHAIVQAERFDPSLLELDLSSLVFMDSTGLRLLLNARQRASEARRRWHHRQHRLSHGTEKWGGEMAAPHSGGAQQPT